MAKSESDIREKKEKKEKKDKKRKHDDVEDATTEKKKKDKKRKSTDVSAPVGVDADGDVIVEDAAATQVIALKEEDDEAKAKVKIEVPLAALVPFANPLCDEKAQKKVLKSVKKAAKHKALKRGVKECVKAVRKSPSAGPAGHTVTPPGIVILAADISPMDVISHIPVLCEDHGIPYVYVPSRAELGAAGSTKRPTSVVMILPRAGKGAKDADGEADGADSWEEAYKDLQKLAVKLGQQVKV